MLVNTKLLYVYKHIEFMCVRIWRVSSNELGMCHLIIEWVSVITNRVQIEFKRVGIERIIEHTDLFTALLAAY